MFPEIETPPVKLKFTAAELDVKVKFPLITKAEDPVWDDKPFEVVLISKFP
jgi:hypothetical protein